MQGYSNSKGVSLVCSLVIIAGTFILYPQSAFPCWADIPISNLAEQSELIVIGKIEKSGEAFHVKAGKSNIRYAVGMITVREVLKGDKVKTVKLAWPAPAPVARPKNQNNKGGGLMVAAVVSMSSTAISYKTGQDGIWLLKPLKNQEGYYLADYPKRLQPLKSRDTVLKAIGGKVSKAD